ncbi:hypothetical protein [Solirubrobacter deserti]|uniref:Uncharacterized protein n=1 Tax=Solirubrobacter deserti TaxID=2282478 RepID=A0ABT4RMQ4_9ACTN|nr:hypothetical protein [Solirubrobacter deserti]MDA0139841.1 hypothetical protein [Solirubrobacter deserti]
MTVDAARAGTMTVYSCQTPSGRPLNASGWVRSASVGGQPAPARGADACSDGGPLSVSLTAPLPEVYPLQAWSFVAAPDTSIAAFSASLCAEVRGTRAFAEVARAGGPVAYATNVWPEWPARLGCDGRAIGGSGFLTESVHLRVWCDAGASCGPGVAASIALSRFRAEIRDDNVPVVTDVHPLGAERVLFDVTDAGVGAYRAVVEARVGQSGPWQELAAKELGCSPLGETPGSRYEFAAPQPCPLRVSGAVVGFTPAALPVGTHDIRFVVEDASGNRADVTPARPYVVAAPAQPPVTTSAPTSILRLRATRARLTGRLLDLSSQPIAGGALEIQSRGFLPKADAATGPWTTIGKLASRANGAFSFALPRGPSRVFRVVHPDGSSSAETTVLAAARVAARARHTRVRNGSSAVISGRVEGPIPDGGVLVGLEVRSNGRWVPVATNRRWVRTRPSGTYSLSYRFRSTFSPTRYRFRVVADEDSAFQYTRGTSRSVSVLVRP